MPGSLQNDSVWFPCQVVSLVTRVLNHNVASSNAAPEKRGAALKTADHVQRCDRFATGLVACLDGDGSEGHRVRKKLVFCFFLFSSLFALILVRLWGDPNRRTQTVQWNCRPRSGCDSHDWFVDDDEASLFTLAPGAA